MIHDTRSRHFFSEIHLFVFRGNDGFLNKLAQNVLGQLQYFHCGTQFRHSTLHFNNSNRFELNILVDT